MSTELMQSRKKIGKDSERKAREALIYKASRKAAKSPEKRS